MRDVKSILGGCGLAGALVLAAGSAWAQENEPIKIGVPTGLSGANSVVAPAVVQSSELAVSEINEAGGIDGRPVELVIVDDGSGAAGAQQAFNRLIFQEEVDAIISMETSAARNAGLPVVSRGRVPYIYTSLYEGRSCNPYLYANGPVPEQMVVPIVDHFIEELGAENFFLVGSDYAFGRGMLEFARNDIEAKGGTIVGEEYQPMDATDWTSIISQMRQADADAIIMSTAGGAPNVTLQKQYKAAGLTAPVGNVSVDEATAKSMGADAEGIYLAASYLSNLESEENREFLEKMNEMFGAELITPNDLSVPQYDAIHLYKLAVEQAGTTEADAVIEALAEVSFQGPRGTVQMSDQRHAPLTMSLGQVQADGSVDVVEVFENVDPGEQCPNL